MTVAGRMVLILISTVAMRVAAQPIGAEFQVNTILACIGGLALRRRVSS